MSFSACNLGHRAQLKHNNAQMRLFVYGQSSGWPHVVHFSLGLLISLLAAFSFVPVSPVSPQFYTASWWLLLLVWVAERGTAVSVAANVRRKLVEKDYPPRSIREACLTNVWLSSFILLVCFIPVVSTFTKKKDNNHREAIVKLKLFPHIVMNYSRLVSLEVFGTRSPRGREGTHLWCTLYSSLALYKVLKSLPSNISVLPS